MGTQALLGGGMACRPAGAARQGARPLHGRCAQPLRQPAHPLLPPLLPPSVPHPSAVRRCRSSWASGAARARARLSRRSELGRVGSPRGGLLPAAAAGVPRPALLPPRARPAGPPSRRRSSPPCTPLGAPATPAWPLHIAPTGCLCRLCFKKLGVEPIIMSAGELEHEWAGTPGKLIRERYRCVGAHSGARGCVCAAVVAPSLARAPHSGARRPRTCAGTLIPRLPKPPCRPRLAGVPRCTASSPASHLFFSSSFSSPLPPPCSPQPRLRGVQGARQAVLPHDQRPGCGDRPL